jgi:hypothetical protein
MSEGVAGFLSECTVCQMTQIRFPCNEMVYLRALRTFLFEFKPGAGEGNCD